MPAEWYGATRTLSLGQLDLWEAARTLRSERYLCLLESRDEGHPLSRTSHLALRPLWTWQVEGARVRSGPAGAEHGARADPLKVLEAGLARLGAALGCGGRSSPPGGLFGYLGYELLHHLERVAAPRPRAAPDAWLFFPGLLVSRDERTGHAHALLCGMGRTRRQAASRLDAQLGWLESWLRRVPARPASARTGGAVLAPEDRLHVLRAAGVHPVTSREAYLRSVETIRGHLAAGDAYQVCLTQRFDVDPPLEASSLYAQLRALHRTPYAAYLRFPGLEVASASLERFLSLDEEGWAETRPLKGTRRRGATAAEDAALRAELLRSEKDRAECVMITDLARNDLGRVCQPGSVHVPQLLGVETHAFTHQMLSVVRGRLRAGLSALDLVRAAFPPGSMTGAPKVAAMQLIRALEPVSRGIYSGAIGRLGLDGTLDLSVVIRTFTRTREGLSFHVGGAVVADSTPEGEYAESLEKAYGLLLAVNRARENKGERHPGERRVRSASG